MRSIILESARATARAILAARPDPLHIVLTGGPGDLAAVQTFVAALRASRAG